jgi:hypothetical protein
LSRPSSRRWCDVTDPRTTVRRLRRTLSGGGTESAHHFTGYGLLSLVLDSGDVITFTRVVASSLGPPFTCVWHRDGAGRWRYHVNIVPSRTCLRYLASDACDIRVGDISLVWKSRLELSLYVRDARLHLGLRLDATAVTRALAAAAVLVPGPVWRREGALRVIGRGAGALLGAGALRLAGRSPTGHAYRRRLAGVWGVAAAAAVLDGRDLGPMLDATRAVDAGGLLLPGRPLFAVSGSEFVAGPATVPGGASDAA